MCEISPRLFTILATCGGVNDLWASSTDILAFFTLILGLLSLSLALFSLTSLHQLTDCSTELRQLVLLSGAEALNGRGREATECDSGRAPAKHRPAGARVGDDDLSVSLKR